MGLVLSAICSKRLDSYPQMKFNMVDKIAVVCKIYSPFYFPKLIYNKLSTFPSFGRNFKIEESIDDTGFFIVKENFWLKFEEINGKDIVKAVAFVMSIMLPLLSVVYIPTNKIGKSINWLGILLCIVGFSIFVDTNLYKIINKQKKYYPLSMVDNFDVGSYKLTGQIKKSIAKNLRHINEIISMSDIKPGKLIIEGHTDNIQIIESERQKNLIQNFINLKLDEVYTEKLVEDNFVSYFDESAKNKIHFSSNVELGFLRAISVMNICNC